MSATIFEAYTRVIDEILREGRLQDTIFQNTVKLKTSLLYLMSHLVDGAESVKTLPNAVISVCRLLLLIFLRMGNVRVLLGHNTNSA